MAENAETPKHSTKTPNHISHTQPPYGLSSILQSLATMSGTAKPPGPPLYLHHQRLLYLATIRIDNPIARLSLPLLLLFHSGYGFNNLSQFAP